MEDFVRNLINELYPAGQPATINAMVTVGLVVIGGVSAAITALVSWSGKKVGFSLWTKFTTPKYRPLFEYFLRQMNRSDTYMDLTSVQNEVVHVELSEDLGEILKISVQVPGDVVWLNKAFTPKEQRLLLNKSRKMIQDWTANIKFQSEQRALNALRQAQLKLSFPVPAISQVTA